MRFTDCEWVSLGLVRTIVFDHVKSLLCGVSLDSLISMDSL